MYTVPPRKSALLLQNFTVVFSSNDILLHFLQYIAPLSIELATLLANVII